MKNVEREKFYGITWLDLDEVEVEEGIDGGRASKPRNLPFSKTNPRFGKSMHTQVFRKACIRRDSKKSIVIGKTVIHAYA